MKTLLFTSVLWKSNLTSSKAYFDPVCLQTWKQSQINRSFHWFVKFGGLNSNICSYFIACSKMPENRIALSLHLSALIKHKSKWQADFAGLMNNSSSFGPSHSNYYNRIGTDYWLSQLIFVNKSKYRSVQVIKFIVLLSLSYTVSMDACIIYFASHFSLVIIVKQLCWTTNLSSLLAMHKSSLFVIFMLPFSEHQVTGGDSFTINYLINKTNHISLVWNGLPANPFQCIYFLEVTN